MHESVRLKYVFIAINYLGPKDKQAIFEYNNYSLKVCLIVNVVQFSLLLNKIIISTLSLYNIVRLRTTMESY